MALKIPCPACNTTLGIPDHLSGKKIRCKNCQHAFVPANQPDDIPTLEVLSTSEPKYGLQIERKPRSTSAQDFDVKQVSSNSASRPQRKRERMPHEEPGSLDTRTIGILVGTLSLVIVGCVVAFIVSGTGDEYPKDSTIPSAKFRQKLAVAQAEDVIAAIDEEPPFDMEQLKPNPALARPPLANDAPGMPNGRNVPNPQPRKTTVAPPIKLPALALDNAPTPTQGKAESLGVLQTKPGLRYRELQFGIVLPCMCWSRDNKSLLTVDSKGKLCKRSWPDLKMVRMLDMNRPASHMAISKQGIVVAFEGQEEVWLIDDQTLEVKKRFQAPKVERVAAAPTSDYVYCFSGYRSRVKSVSVIHLAEGITYSHESSRFGRSGLHGSFKNAVMTPDGKYIFSEEFEQLTRHRIEGIHLIREEASRRIASNGQSIQVSHDSQYVCLPAGGGNGAGYSTFLYNVNDLSKRVGIIESGAYPRSLGFDPTAKLIYAQDFDTQLKVYNIFGVLKNEYVLARRGQEPKQFLVHPAGRQGLLLCPAARNGTTSPLFWFQVVQQ